MNFMNKCPIVKANDSLILLVSSMTSSRSAHCLQNPFPQLLVLLKMRLLTCIDIVLNFLKLC